jgi:hypothetical protein
MKFIKEEEFEFIASLEGQPRSCTSEKRLRPDT